VKKPLNSKEIANKQMQDRNDRKNDKLYRFKDEIGKATKNEGKSF
jgi:hypothetical protein